MTSGELFGRERPPPLSVSEVNQKARLLLERNFMRVQVVGEVSGHKIVSGHHYFSLRDAESQLSAVLFRREAMGLRFNLQSGALVVATGRLTIYPQQGRYQMVLDAVEPRGAGSLAAAFEAQKARLLAEGLFDQARKRALPRLPRRVAVVTSPTGAVIRDIIHVATRRFPNPSILVVPTRVQGAEAVPEIVRAIERAQKAPDIDVIIVARGGGSLEDLWCFNDERVARAIFAATIPVVSAVGHETDFTIADFVADVRAPTPSAAAELVFPEQRELMLRLSRPLDRAEHCMRQTLRRERLHVRALLAELGDGSSLLHGPEQRLAEAMSRCEAALAQRMNAWRRRVHESRLRLSHLHPRVHLRELSAQRKQAHERSVAAMRARIRRERDELKSLSARLAALSPLGVLERGYAIVLDTKGHAVRDPSSVRSGDALDIRVERGRIAANVRGPRE